MRKLESAGSTTSARDKYAGYPIDQRDSESDYKFLQRIVTEVILEIKSSITVHSLIKELEQLTGMGIDRGFLLSTIIFKDSGIVISGDLIWASTQIKKRAENILRAGEREVNLAGGKINKSELFARIRKRTIQPLSDAVLHASLLHKRTNLKWKLGKGGETIIYFKK
jgi:hypothetical protein